MASRVTKIEYGVLSLIVVLFAVSAGKYYKNIDVPKNVSQKFSEIQRAVTPNKRLSQIERNQTVTNSAILASSYEGWYLSGKNLPSLEVLKNKKTGNVNLVSYAAASSSAASVFVEGIGLFESRNGVIDLQIPYTFEDTDFITVYEQEDFVPIFGYHDVLSDEDEITAPTIQIHESDFREQIKFATEELGCVWYTFGDITENYILQNIKTPKNACVLTFDDGFVSSYTRVLPILNEYDAIATFYIIVSKLDRGDRYLDWNRLREIYFYGNEIGSHAYNSGGLLSQGWTAKELLFQLKESKEVLEEQGYGPILTFAYPLGEWSEEIVELAKEVGYIAGRDTQKDNGWRENRPLTASYDNDFLWNMFYFRPELSTKSQIKEILGYNTFWQFEEGYRIVNETNEPIRTLSSIRPTDTSYAVVRLQSAGDTIGNKFILSSTGTQTITLYLGQKGNKITEQIAVYVDGEKLEVTFSGDSTCKVSGNWNFCEYTVVKNLEEGLHEIAVATLDKTILLDKFTIHRTVPIQNNFQIYTVATKK